MAIHSSICVAIAVIPKMSLLVAPAPHGVDVGARIAAHGHVWAPVLPRALEALSPDPSLPPPFSSFGAATAWRLIRCDAPHAGSCADVTVQRAAAAAAVVPRLLGAVPTVFGITENKRVAAAARNAKKKVVAKAPRRAEPESDDDEEGEDEDASSSDSESESESSTGSESEDAGAGDDADAADKPDDSDSEDDSEASDEE